MAEIIPSINCHYGDFGCVREKIRKAESFAKWVHLDVSDGVFTFNKSWNDPSRWSELKTNCKLEVHLMTEDPEELVEKWLKVGAKRIIVHAETLSGEQNAKHIAEKCRKRKAEAMLAINPETPVDDIRNYFGIFSSYQILAVYPGPAGQRFLPAVIPKIRELRVALPSATIEVDGGIVLETARLAKEAGANIVIAGTYTLGSTNPKRAYEELKRV